MGLVKRFSLVLIIGFFLSSSKSYAQQIKYSFGPACKENKVVCSGTNEVPVCIATDNGIHIQTIVLNGQTLNQFQPSCGAFNDSLLPTCIDIANEDQLAPKHIVVECVEFPKCSPKENDNKLVAVCSDGKLPKCLGDDSDPSCGLETYSTCTKGIAVCDYTWQANAN